MTNHSSRFGWRYLVLVSACLAARSAGATGVRLSAGALSSRGVAAPVGAAARSSVDPQVQDVAAALRGAHARMVADREARPSGRQRAAVGRLRQQLGSSFDVRLRAPQGTPRQVRGACLERAHGWFDRAASDYSTAQTFLRDNRDLLRLEDPDQELALQKRQEDHLGRRQLRFAQRYRGVEVWPAELIAQVNAQGDLDGVDGAFAATPQDLSVVATRDAAAAIAAARAAVDGGDQLDATEAVLIVYIREHGTPRLAWRVRLAGGLDVRWLVVVDDHDGEPLQKLTETLDADVSGSGVDLFGATRAVHVWSEGGTNYLVDTSKPMYDASSDPPGVNSTRGAVLVLDARHGKQNANGNLSLEQITSTNPTGGWLRDGISAAFGLSQTFDYYRTMHNRNSLDGNGGSILGVVRYDQNFSNAFWNGQLMVFGDAQPYAGALDVVAHELTHGVTQHSANLQYQNQSGALNEAMSDIFGEATELRTNGTNDWLLGASLGAPLRNMANPHALTIGSTGRPYPANMSELIGPNDSFLDQFNNRDSGGVHLNSSIINHAFYQLAAGLPGAIGMEDAAKIFYRALTAHLVVSSQFIDCRLAAVQSAVELFGDGDARVQRVREAFDAVGIVDGTATPPPDPFPGTDGEDAYLFLYYDQNAGPRLGRRENALGDGAIGTQLGANPAATRRPAVTGNGATAAYVTTSYDVCFVDTDNPGGDSCVNRTGQFNSIALSPDGTLAGLVLRDQNGPTDELTVIELRDNGSTTTYPLRAPAFDDGSFDTVRYASQLDFSADNRWLIYDAFNEVSLIDETAFSAWSIYALDVQTDTTQVVVQPTATLDIGNPSFAQRSDDHIVFEAYSSEQNNSTIYAARLSTGEVNPLGTVNGNVGVPGYNGDDTAVVLTVPDGNVSSGADLIRQAVGPDRISPTGTASTVLTDGYYGIVYRRGSFSGPPACPSDASCDDGDPCTIDHCDAVSGCQYTGRSSGGIVACLYPVTSVNAACQSDAGYGRIDARLQAALSKFEQSETAPKAKKRRALARRGIAILNKLRGLSKKLEHKQQVTTACRDSVLAFVQEARSRIGP